MLHFSQGPEQEQTLQPMEMSHSDQKHIYTCMHTCHIQMQTDNPTVLRTCLEKWKEAAQMDQSLWSSRLLSLLEVCMPRSCLAQIDFPQSPRQPHSILPCIQQFPVQPGACTGFSCICPLEPLPALLHHSAHQAGLCELQLLCLASSQVKTTRHCSISASRRQSWSLVSQPTSPTLATVLAVAVLLKTTVPVGEPPLTAALQIDPGSAMASCCC